MDFNTGRDPGDLARGRESASGGASGREFDYSDPLQSFIETVRSVVQRPADFFRGIARSGDYVNPLVFALICAEVAALFNGILRLLGVGNDQGFGGFIVSLILTPVGATIALFIAAGILHLLVMLIAGPARSGFEATFRVSAYSSVMSLLSWIPFIGWIFGLYGIYLSIVGIREMHSTTTGRAAAIVLIPAAVVFLLVLLLIILVGAVLFFGTRG